MRSSALHALHHWDPDWVVQTACQRRHKPVASAPPPPAAERAAYTEPMDVSVVDPARETAGPAQRVATSAPAPDPIAHLAAVYRDYPGLRALILRRVRDPELAADILQDAAVTTLEKLKAGAIAHPDGVGGYMYRVALNHLRNHRRKDRGQLSSAENIEELADDDGDPDWHRIGRTQWAQLARRTLEELPTTRDREILVRFYLQDEAKEQICTALGLSRQHFNRVVFRARNRFRALLEDRGYVRLDMLMQAGLILLASALQMVVR